MISVAQIQGKYVTYAWAFPSANAARAALRAAASQRGVRAAREDAVRAATRVVRPGQLLRDDLFWVHGKLLLQVGAYGLAGHPAAAIAAGARGPHARRERVRTRMSWNSAKAAERVARTYAAPDLAAVRERQVDLLAPQPGWRIADIGCGPGAFAAALCARGAQVTAIDSARAMLDAVEARALGCELVEADALALPLADDSHDAACLVQVLEYVGDPVAALREAARIVRPGGHVLAADTDWDTQGFNVADRELGRRVVQAYADGKPDGWAGRRLHGWLAAAGLVPEERCAVVLDATEWGGDTFIAHNWPHYAARPREVGAHLRRRPRALRGRDRRVRRERRVLLERRPARMARARAGRRRATRWPAPRERTP